MRHCLRRIPHLSTCLFAACMLASGAAYAEPARFLKASMVVLPASLFVNEAAGTSYTSNDELVFTQKPGAAGLARGAPVSVRVFRLSAGESVPREWAVLEPCWVYMSNLFDVVVNVNGTIKLGTLTPGWLHAVVGKPMAAASYLVIFQSGPGDGHDLFRLNRAERDDYFRHGIVVEVRPARQFAQDEVDAQARADARASAKILAEARVNDRAVRCYVARVTAEAPAGESAVQYALNEDCNADSVPF